MRPTTRPTLCPLLDCELAAKWYGRRIKLLRAYAAWYLAFLCLAVSLLFAGDPSGLRVGASTVNFQADGKMVLAGMIESRYSENQEGELRSIAVVCEKPGINKIAIVACDVLWLPRSIVDETLKEIEAKTGIAPDNVLVNATHTHHAPITAPAYDFGVSPP